MALELKDFTALKEIQSLDNLIKVHLDAIKSEESRKDSVLALRSKRETEMVGFSQAKTENTALMAQLEKELHEWEKKREQAIVNQERAKDQKQIEAIEKELLQVTSSCEELEEKILSLLEKNDELESLIEEAQTFLKGSLETLNEIDKEIDEETKEERRHIDNYELRIKALLEEIPPSLAMAFEKARQRYRFNFPLARLINKACEKCRYEVDSQNLSLIDQAKTISHCNQCERLLIPFDS